MEPCPRALLTFGNSSGNPSRSKKAYEDTTHYVIVTATMDMREAQRVDAQIQALKTKHFPKANPERVSFHANGLLSKLSRYTGQKAVAETQFQEVFTDVMKITKDMDATINTTVMDKMSPDENYRTSSTIIASWAQTSAMIRHTLRKTTSKTTGITILDRYDDATNRIVAATMAQFLGHPLAFDESAITTISRPIFADSASCNLIQLVDMIAFVVARNYKNNPSDMFTHLYSQLEHRLSHTAHIVPT